MSNRKKLLIMCFTSPLKDMRFLREIEFLRKDFDVTVAGAAPGVSDLPFEEIRCKPETRFDKLLFRIGLLLGTFYPLYSRYSVSTEFLKKAHFDLVLCNDLLPLPLAFRIAKGAPVFWDAHEYYPEELGTETIGQRCSNRAAHRLCQKLIPRLKAMSSVCPTICNRYRTEFKLKETPLLIRNIPLYEELSPSQKKEGRFRMIHHGGINRDRKLELMIETMDLLDHRFSLDFLLVHNKNNVDYYEFLKERASHNPRICFLPPVKNKDLVKATNEYDLGLFFIPPTNYNYENCLPNKLFEFIQARLGVAVGPSPEMAEIVRTYQLGIISETFSAKSIAEALNRLTDNDIVQFKSNANSAAQVLCAEKEMSKLIETVKNIISL